MKKDVRSFNFISYDLELLDSDDFIELENEYKGITLIYIRITIEIAKTTGFYLNYNDSNRKKYNRRIAHKASISRGDIIHPTDTGDYSKADLVEKAITILISNGMFDELMYKQHQILTSVATQNTYSVAFARRNLGIEDWEIKYILKDSNLIESLINVHKWYIIRDGIFISKKSEKQELLNVTFKELNTTFKELNETINDSNSNLYIYKKSNKKENLEFEEEEIKVVDELADCSEISKEIINHIMEKMGFGKIYNQNQYAYIVKYAEYVSKLNTEDQKTQKNTITAFFKLNTGKHKGKIQNVLGSSEKNYSDGRLRESNWVQIAVEESEKTEKKRKKTKNTQNYANRNSKNTGKISYRNKADQLIASKLDATIR